MNRFLTDGDAPEFPLKFDKLVELSKELINTKFGCTKTKLLAEDFQFRFPIVELDKTRFVEAFASFKLDDAFPDMTTDFYGENAFVVPPAGLCPC